jgi:fido (protein-threonine AMPylation protein)
MDMVKPEALLSGASVEYSHYKAIRDEARQAFRALNSRDWQAMDMNQKGRQFSIDLAEIWRVHAFREGNTRTIMTFAAKYATARGMPLYTPLLAEHPDYVRGGLVVASFGRSGDLAKIMTDSMKRAQEMEPHRERKPVLDMSSNRELER